MQNTTKAMTTSRRTRPWKSISPPAAAGAATTRTFFTHCFGRRALTIPSTRLRGGPGEVEPVPRRVVAFVSSSHVASFSNPEV